MADPLIPPTAAVTAIGCPGNGGPPEQATDASRAHAHRNEFTRQLGSELRRALSQQGFQSMTLPPWDLPPAYSSPSQLLSAADLAAMFGGYYTQL
jgi:hypothetical protein